MFPGSEAVEGFAGTLKSTSIQTHGAEVQAWSWLLLLRALRADRGEVCLSPLVGGTHGDPYPLPSVPEVIRDSKALQFVHSRTLLCCEPPLGHRMHVRLRPWSCSLETMAKIEARTGLERMREADGTFQGRPRHSFLALNLTTRQYSAAPPDAGRLCLAFEPFQVACYSIEQQHYHVLLGAEPDRKTLTQRNASAAKKPCRRPKSLSNVPGVLQAPWKRDHMACNLIFESRKTLHEA